MSKEQVLFFGEPTYVLMNRPERRYDLANDALRRYDAACLTAPYGIIASAMRAQCATPSNRLI
jgi:hypothetical protein